MARFAYSSEQVDGWREDIISAAMRLFESEGIEAVSFRRIAAELGCSYTAPYRYFPNKAALVTGLRERTYRWMETCLTASIVPETSPLTQLGDLAQAYIRAGLDRPSRYALLFDLSQEGVPSAALQAARRDAFYVCVRVVEAVERSGELRLKADALTTAHLFWAGAHGVVSLQLAQQFELGRRVEQLIPRMIQTLIEGIRAA